MSVALFYFNRIKISYINELCYEQNNNILVDHHMDGIM